MICALGGFSNFLFIFDCAWVFIVVPGLLIAAASLVAEHRL